MAWTSPFTSLGLGLPVGRAGLVTLPWAGWLGGFREMILSVPFLEQLWHLGGARMSVWGQQLLFPGPRLEGCSQDRPSPECFGLRG